MAVLSGAISMLRQNIDTTVHRHANNSSSVSGTHTVSVQTTHSAIFDINGQIVSITGSVPIILFDGDQVVVGGRLKGDGVFHATAYENETRRVRGGSDLGWEFYFLAMFCIIFSSIWFLFSSDALSGEQGDLWSIFPFFGPTVCSVILIANGSVFLVRAADYKDLRAYLAGR